METIEQLLQKVDELKKGNKLDLSLEEDLSVAVMNLISLEEHLYFSGVKTNKETYYDSLQSVRVLRQKLLTQLLGQVEGEVWCISKHLLASTMRLIEVGTRYQQKGDKKKAKDLFDSAWQLYSLFWGIKLGAIKIGEKKKEPQKKNPKIQEQLEEVMKKLVDCCK